MPKKHERQRYYNLIKSHYIINEEKNLREIQKRLNEERLLSLRLMKEKTEYLKHKKLLDCCQNINKYILSEAIMSFTFIEKIKLLSKKNIFKNIFNEDIIKYISLFHNNKYRKSFYSSDYYIKIPFYIHFKVDLNLLKSKFKPNILFHIDDFNIDDFNYTCNELCEPDTYSDSDYFSDNESTPYCHHQKENNKRNSKTLSKQQKYLKKLRSKNSISTKC